MNSILLALSPWLAFVFDYSPAPGQFINEIPEITPDATTEDVLQIVAEQITGARTPGLITLGSFGGSVTVGFDHPVVNVAGTPDFAIYGNAVTNGAEPGIVMVSQDTNGNGLPDDEWYELAGSLEEDPGTRFGYTITYRKSAEGKEMVKHPSWKFVTDAEYIPWSDSEGSEGYVMKIASHPQSYWPEWVDAEELTFSGTCLPGMGMCSNDAGTMWTIQSPEWGYADAKPNKDSVWFDISNAVDKDRNRVSLPQIDFVKIYSAVNQFRGWLGESSTEIAGGEDLHPQAEPSGVEMVAPRVISSGVRGGYLLLTASVAMPYAVCDLSGRQHIAGLLTEGLNYVPVSGLGHGIYLVNCDKVIKFAL